MGDMGEVFKLFRKHKQDKKSDNIKKSTQLLIDEGIDFITQNFGIHLIITCWRGKVDFWPSTGRWIFRDKDFRGRGVKSLIYYIKNNQVKK